MTTEPKVRRFFCLGVVIVMPIFIVDIYVPLGVAGGIPYVAVVLVALWFPQRRAVVYVAIAGSILTILGYFLSPAGSSIPWMILVNRGLALGAIWITAILGLQRKVIEESLLI